MCCESALGTPPIVCNGPCVQPNNDNQNCGGCGKACAQYQNCVSGVGCICAYGVDSNQHCLPPPDGG